MTDTRFKVVNVVGARPNFMKVAPLMRAYEAEPRIEAVLVHTGQHYDERMSDLFFRELAMPEPDINLDVGSGSHGVQTADILTRFEQVLLDLRPDAVVVAGDVNSTIACGLAAVKLDIRLAHLEAGLRSFDRAMPEEINRIATDAISDLLLCTEESAVRNLRAEGVAEDKIAMVGNAMVDSLLRNRERAARSTIVADLGLEERGYAVLTLHRPSNVDDPAVLGRIFEALEEIQQETPVVFPAHPRTRATLDRAGLLKRVEALPGLRLLEPAGYLDFVRLCDRAKLVLTDSGGIQEETTILGVPCLTLRHNTERPVTVDLGTNQLVGNDPERILEGYRAALADGVGAARIPPLWDGSAAERVVPELMAMLDG